MLIAFKLTELSQLLKVDNKYITIISIKLPMESF